MDVEGMPRHCYEGENDDYNYDDNYEYYESEQYDDEYRPSSSSNYNLYLVTVVTVTHIIQPGVMVMTAVIHVM